MLSLKGGFEFARGGSDGLGLHKDRWYSLVDAYYWAATVPAEELLELFFGDFDGDFDFLPCEKFSWLWRSCYL